MMLPTRLVLALATLLWVSVGSAQAAKETPYLRSLAANDQRLLTENEANTRRLSDVIVYYYNVILTYAITDDYVNNGSPKLEEVQDIVRLTEVYYRRLLGAKYSIVYQDVRCQYFGGEAGIQVVSFPPFTLIQFAVDLTTSYRLAGKPPNYAQSFDAVREGFDSFDYIENFARLALPGNFAP
jgi:hypothetical protein